MQLDFCYVIFREKRYLKMNFTIKLLDVVALLENLPEPGLYRGQVGTVVDEYDAEFVEVEFSDLQGRTYALEALSKSQLMIDFAS
jgi:Domain of unknown function (DUF4926)